MRNKDQQRIIELQRQLKIARTALVRIKAGGRDPEGAACTALYEMMPLDNKQPLQGLVGHEKRQSND